jgi:FG-GAP repeat
MPLGPPRRYGLPAMLVAALLSMPASAQFTQQAQIVASPSAATAEGLSVSLSDDGNTALIGAPCYPDGCPPTAAPGQGAAFVLSRSGGTWSVVTKLQTTAEAGQGWSVAISGDGNTAIVGGPDLCFECYGATGAAWVFANVGGTWVEQAMLIGSAITCGALGSQGSSVALSYNGNVALIGGPEDNCGVGAAWVFVRSRRGVWRQQTKLVASDAIGRATLGRSVALSRDGGIAVVGGPIDNYSSGSAAPGAAWVFRWSHGAWSEVQKLVAEGAIGNPGLGNSVAVSKAGGIILVGGPNDNRGAGAAWIFAARAGSWQQRAKLVGTDAIGPAFQGYSVSLSANAKIIMLGGPDDDETGGEPGVGAAWIFTYAHRTWTQQSKLIGTGYAGYPQQGLSTTLSADGSTAFLGGPYDDTITDEYGAPGVVGAAWAFTAEPETSRLALK